MDLRGALVVEDSGRTGKANDVSRPRQSDNRCTACPDARPVGGLDALFPRPRDAQAKDRFVKLLPLQTQFIYNLIDVQKLSPEWLKVNPSRKRCTERSR
jgi:hypothetical protein